MGGIGDVVVENNSSPAARIIFLFYAATGLIDDLDFVIV